MPSAYFWELIVQKPTVRKKTANHPDNVREIEERAAGRSEFARQDALRPKSKEVILFESQMIELDHRYEWMTKEGFLITSMKFKNSRDVLKPVIRLYGPSLPIEGVEAPVGIASSFSGASITGIGRSFHKLSFYGVVQAIANPIFKSIEDFDYSRLSQISKKSDLWKNTIAGAIEELGLDATLAKVLTEIYEEEAKRPKNFVGGNSVGWGHRSYD